MSIIFYDRRSFYIVTYSQVLFVCLFVSLKQLTFITSWLGLNKTKLFLHLYPALVLCKLMDTILQFHLLSLLSTKNAVQCGESTRIVYKKTINFAFIHPPHITTTKPNSTNHSTFDGGLNYVMLRYFGMCHR